MIGLPLNINEVCETTEIDMNNLNFPCDKSEQVNAAMLFIRNLDIHAKFIFDNCIYEFKEEYLVRYMTRKNFDIDIEILTSTWINILAYEYGGTNQPSILTKDELSRFVENNDGIIFEMKRLLVSIPLVAMDFFRESLIKDHRDGNIDLSEFDVSSYEPNDTTLINTGSFVRMFDYEELVVIQQAIQGIEPMWFINYFQKENNRFYGQFISKFPYLDMLNMFIPENEGIQNEFIEQLKNFLES